MQIDSSISAICRSTESTKGDGIQDIQSLLDSSAEVDPPSIVDSGISDIVQPSELKYLLVSTESFVSS